MADDPETNPQEHNLELPPLLGFARFKRGRKAGRGSAEPVSPDDGQGGGREPDAVADAETAVPQDDDPLSADPVPEPRGGLAPAAGATKRLPPVPPPSRGRDAPPSRIPSPPPLSEPEQSSDRPVDLPVTESDRREPAPAPPPPAPTPVAPAPLEQSAEETTVLPAVGREEQVDDSSDAAASVTAADHHRDKITAGRAGPDFTVPGREPVGSPEESTPVEGSALSDEPRKARKPRKPRKPRKSRSLKLPVIKPLIAALVTGLLVGLLTVVLTYLANRGCEGVRGVGSCGSFGLLALLAVVAVDVVVGAALLKAWRLTDPTGTAFLGVGLMAVFVLLFLLGSLESSWMLLVMPLVAAAGFVGSWWVTATFVENNLDVRR